MNEIVVGAESFSPFFDRKVRLLPWSAGPVERERVKRIYEKFRNALDLFPVFIVLNISKYTQHNLRTRIYKNISSSDLNKRTKCYIADG